MQRLRAIEIYDYSWIQTRYGQARVRFDTVAGCPVLPPDAFTSLEN